MADLTFVCEECGERIALPDGRRGHVEACPHCGGFVDMPDGSTGLPAETEQPSPPKRTDAQLWVEVAAVLYLAYVPALFWAIADLQGWCGSNQALVDLAASIILAAEVVMPVLFASYHVYQGPVGVLSAATSGLVYAISFCLFRRLWPVVVAHVVWNLLTI